MELVLDQLDAAACDYPAPRIPLLPVLSPASLGRTAGDRPVSRFLAPDARFVRTGRAGLAIIMQHLGLKPGERVLVPGYHCPSMLTPILHFGATPVFYRLHPDLSPDLDDVRTRLAPGVRACLLPHYFGFPQTRTPDLLDLCRAAGVALIEDCAHAFFGALAGTPLGGLGDYAIASSRKFFPGKDGGFVACNRPGLPLPTLVSDGFKAELRNLFDSLHYANRAGHWRAFTPLFRAIEARPRPMVPTAMAAVEPVAQAAEREFAITPDDLHHAGTRVSRAIIARSDHAALASARRANYQAWLRLVAGLPGLRPLYPELPDGVVPYVFPVLLDQPGRHFPVLKRLGFPIYRWEYLGPSDCALSRDYGLSLWQLPVQQTLNEADRAWLFDTLTSILQS